MALFWLVYRNDDEVRVSVQDAQHLTAARLKAMLAGLAGEFAEGYQLDNKISRKLPKSMIGRELSRAEAEALLVKMG